MSVRIFTDYDEGVEALKDAGPGFTLVPTQWALRLPSWDEIEEEQEYDDEAVQVSFSFSSRVDLYEDTMRDQDWISLGKMVAMLARDARSRQ